MTKLIHNWKKYNLPLFLVESARSLYYIKTSKGKKEKKYVTRKKYGKKKKLTAEQTNEYYRELIMSGKPFVAGRLGTGEARRVNRYIMMNLGLSKEYAPSHIKSVVINNSPELADWYCEQILELLPNVDIMPAWCSIGEPYLVRKFAHKTKLCRLEDIEPFWNEHPWTNALKGKKVLVINPFDESIRMQYEKRELLFENKEILPEFELKTLKSVMVLTPEDNTYGTIIDVVDYTYNEAMKIDFDIALLGCGQVGMILAEKFRQQGKQAIYLGGILQILFGIKGKRWDVQEKYKKMYNEYWTYPIEEPPKGYQKVEGGCYWQ